MAKAISRLLYKVGFSHHWTMAGFSRALTKITILMYHSVEPHPGPYVITCEVFQRQLDFIKEKYSVIRLREAETVFRDQSDQERKVIITFDDAYRNFLEFAYPILKRFALPCTVFVPTRFIGKSNEWDLDEGIYKQKRLMDRDELFQLSSEGLVDFGSHTVDHISMRDLARSEMERQAIESRRDLEELFHHPIEMFAYPYGQLRHFSDATTQVLAAAGYRIAVTTRWGTVNSSRERMTLRRIFVDEADENEDLRAKIEGQYDWFAAKERMGHGLFLLKSLVKRSQSWRRERQAQ